MLKKLSYLLTIALLGLILSAPELKAQDPPAGCSFTTSGKEVLESFNFDNKNINYTTDYATALAYVDTKLTGIVESGKTYSFSGQTGLYYTSYYSHYMRLFVDWNQDGDFSDAGEIVWTSGYVTSYSGSMTVPASTPAGKYRMRMFTGEYNSYPGYSSGCGDGGSWSNATDFFLHVKSGYDGGMTAVTNPTSPFAVGTYSVVGTFKNFGDKVLTSATINWMVDGKSQTPLQWTGSLSKGNSISVNLGNFNFNYPPTGPFNPFTIETWTTNLNGQAADDDVSNNKWTQAVTPFLNDAGVVGFFGPAEGFGPGSTPVRARVKNYAPKPITSVRIRWSIDGVEQTMFTANGLNIPYLGTADIVIGNYTFYNKTPMGPFSVKAWTEVPNGVIDEDKTNDTYNGGIGPSFVPGTYTIGGYNAHFANIQDASSYLSASGVMGSGDVYFDIRPGSYNGQITLNANLPNNNKIYFRSSTGRASDVTVEATPGSVNNFVFWLDGMKNVYLSNLTLKNNASNFSLAGRVLVVNNGNNINLENCNVFGIANSPKDASYANILFNNTSNSKVSNNIILNGSIGIRNEGSLSNLNSSFDNNIISDYSWMGISNNLATPNHNVVITNNVIRNTNTLKPSYGISSVNGTVITNNMIDGLTGTAGDAKEAGIYLSATSMPSDYTVVSGNQITNLVNVNGIFAENTKIKVMKNLVNATLTTASNKSLFVADNTVGYAGINNFNGSNIAGARIINSNDFYFLYNTVVNNSTTYPTVYTSVNSGMINRNIFQNLSTGAVTDYWGTMNCNENNYYTSGASLIKYNGTTYTLAGFQALGMDVNSSNVNVVFEDAALNNMKLKTYIPALLKSTPIAGLPEPMNTDLQSTDYEGNPKASYYIGSDEIKLEIMIDRQSKGIVDCIGGLDNNISVSARMSYGAIPTYQWEKDGVAIPGQNKEIMFFNAMKLSDNGVYRCLISGPGDTKSKYSEPVTVYVVTPTEITEEPKHNIIPLGETAVFTFQAHVNGRKVEDALKLNEISIQWYKVRAGGDVALADDKRTAGAKSNLMTIKGFLSADEGEYYAVITGLCGTATTAKGELKVENLTLSINQQPTASTNCEGEDVIFSIEATTPSSKVIAYQWFKDGVVIAETPNSTGTKSSHLTLYGVDNKDAGTYNCEVSLVGTTVMEKSADAALAVDLKPVIKTQPINVEVQVSKDFTLDVELEDANGATYQWYMNGKVVGTDKSFTKTGATPEDAGKYWVIATNNCGKVTSTQVDVVVTTGTSDVTDKTMNGFVMSGLTPNPSNEVAELTLNVPSSEVVRIVITDMSGKEVLEVANSTMNIGSNRISINVSNLSNGVYYVVMQSGNARLMQKLNVVK